MKLPSLGSIGSAAVKTAAKYPLPLAMAALTAITSVYALESSNGENFAIVRIALTAGLGAALFLAAQSLPIARKWQAALFAIISLFLVAYAYGFEEIQADHYAFALHCLAAVVAVIIAPFAFRRGTSPELWERGKSLFLRGALAALYTLVLYGGIALALASLDQLFGVHWKEWFHIEIYVDLWFILAFFVGPWIFLAGIPGAETETEPRPFPRSVRAFALYVLLPIAGVYLLILYAYSINILIQWSLPNGWVTSLIMTYSVVGLVTLLLLYPLLRSGELGARFAKAPRIFFITLLPLLVLQYFAIARRLADYGLTENRYFVIVAMIWLAGISLYYIAEGFSKIKIIPLSLFFALALVSFGPWGAFALAEASQTNRLMNILRESGALKDGKLHKGVKFSDRQAREINALSRHLDFTYNNKALKEELAAYGAKLDSDMKNHTELLKLLDSKSLNEFRKDVSNTILIEMPYEINLDGAERLISFDAFETKSFEREILIGDMKLKASIELKGDRPSLKVTSGNGEALIEFRPIIEKLAKNTKSINDRWKPAGQLSYIAAGKDFQVKLTLTEIEFETEPEYKVRAAKGMIFIKRLY
ncbi:MAG: DUF4153 domain-containing protein [Chloroflexota bacterium]